MRYYLLLLIAFQLFTPISRSDEKPKSQPEIRADSVEWKHIFGKPKSYTTRPSTDVTPQAYSLMSEGFMGVVGLGSPKFAPDMDQQITDWLKAHPKAKVKPIREMSLGDDAKMTYCWVVDGNTNLNIHLVRRGCCLAANMEITIYPSDLLISNQEYEKFVSELAKAELAAIDEKLGLWVNRKDTGLIHWRRADNLEKQGKLKEAIEEFKKAIDMGNSVSSGWFRIAKCYDRLDNYKAALDAFDKAIAVVEETSGIRIYQLEKARCIAKHEGSDKAVAMLNELIRNNPEDSEAHDMLSLFYQTQKQPKLAAKVLEESVAIKLKDQNIKFNNENMILWNESRIKRSSNPMSKDKYWEEVQGLAHTLLKLAELYLKIEEYDKAWKYSTMALSIRQRPTAVTEGKPSMAEAGDVDCRLLRASIYIRQTSFEKAKVEIDYARKWIDEAEDWAGKNAKQKVNQAYVELQKNFPDRKVELPAPPKSKKELTTADYVAASEDELFRMAADMDNGVSYAALTELVDRHSNGKLAAGTIKRLVDDGLKRQGDLKQIWRPHYGGFIEIEWENGKLTNDQLSQYIRHSIPPPKLEVKYIHPEDNFLKIDPLQAEVKYEPRLGYYKPTNGKPKEPTKIFTIIQLTDGRIDGKNVSIFKRHSDDPVVTSVVGGPRGTQGNYLDVKNYGELKPGTHTLEMQCSIEVKEGTPGIDLDQNENQTAPSLAKWSVKLASEFEVPDAKPTKP